MKKLITLVTMLAIFASFTPKKAEAAIVGSILLLKEDVDVLGLGIGSVLFGGMCFAAGLPLIGLVLDENSGKQTGLNKLSYADGVKAGLSRNEVNDLNDFYLDPINAILANKEIKAEKLNEDQYQLSINDEVLEQYAADYDVDFDQLAAYLNVLFSPVAE